MYKVSAPGAVVVVSVALGTSSYWVWSVLRLVDLVSVWIRV